MNDLDNCKPEARVFAPVIDRNRCEGKAECVRVCPYDVSTIGTLSRQDRRELSFLGKLKGLGHGFKQAYATNAGACHACARCVAACPERAIKLIRLSPQQGMRP